MTGKIIYIKVSVILLMILSSPGTFLNAQKLSDTLRISAVEVYSGRPLKATGLVKTKLDSFELREKSNSSLAEVLSEHTHVFIKTYGRGAMASASFRGTAPSHTKVTWNGIELNSPMLGMADFSIIPVFFIYKVELYHGNSSIGETTGALGGLISLSTIPDWSGDNFSGTIQQAVGSFGSHDEYIGMKAGSKRFNSQTRLFYSHSDNDFNYLNNDIIDSVNLKTGRKYHPVMRNTEAWFTNYGLLQEFQFRPTEKDFLSLSFWGQESSRSIPQLSTNEAGLNNNINRDNSTIIRGVLSYKRYIRSAQFKAFSGINYLDSRYKLHNRIHKNLMLNQIKSESRALSLYNHIEYSIELKAGTQLNLSADFNIYKVHSFEEVQGFGYDKSRFQPSLLASLVKKWDKRWRSNITLATEMVDNEFLPLIFNGGIEYHILPGDMLYLHAGIAGNSKYPTLNDMYFQPGGNSLLKPEKSFNQELGIHFKAKVQRFLIESEFSAYNSSVRDWILWLPTFKGYWVPENVNQVNNRGIETNLCLSVDESVIRGKIKLNYSLTNSVNKGDTKNPMDRAYGSQLPFIPVHSANCFVTIMYKTWTLNYLWNYYSQRFTTTSNQVSSLRDYLYPYFMNQVGISKQMSINSIRTELNFKIHNLFNEKYRSVLQRPMPGRNITFQTKIIF